jgi:hypothetical protein
MASLRILPSRRGYRFSYKEPPLTSPAVARDIMADWSLGGGGEEGQ